MITTTFLFGWRMSRKHFGFLAHPPQKVHHKLASTETKILTTLVTNLTSLKDLFDTKCSLCAGGVWNLGRNHLEKSRNKKKSSISFYILFALGMPGRLGGPPHIHFNLFNESYQYANIQRGAWFISITVFWYKTSHDSNHLSLFSRLLALAAVLCYPVKGFDGL